MKLFDSGPPARDRAHNVEFPDNFDRNFDLGYQVETYGASGQQESIYATCPECTDESPRFSTAPEGVDNLSQWMGGHGETCLYL
jgi:hypothetical protein